MSLVNKEVNQSSSEYIYRYVTQGDYVRDQERFGKMVAFIKDKFQGIQRIVSIGCGSAEESMAIASAGIKYEGYDISPAYSYKFPLDISEEISREGSELGVWFRKQYERYDDIGEELDTLVHPGKMKDKIQISIGKEYDATKPEFWDAIEGGSQDQESLILFRHPDVKDNFDVSNSMIRCSIEMKSPMMITTSNTMSLALLLGIIDRYAESQSESYNVEGLDEKTLGELSSSFDDFQGKLKDREVVDEVLAKLPINPASLKDANSYMGMFTERGNKVYKLNDGSTLKVLVNHTPEFSRDEPYRKLDSWVVTIERVRSA